MFEFAGELEPFINTMFLVATGYIAWHGIRFRDKEGNTETVHLLFGCIAAIFFAMVLFQDVLEVVRF